jgi:hypothetical protein
MNRKNYVTNGSDLNRRGDPSKPDLVEYLWMAKGGIARAQVQADGTIKGVRFSDDGDGSLIEVWIKKPTK